MDREVYEALEMLLTYPEDHQGREIGSSVIINGSPDTAAAEHAAFAAKTAPLSLHDRQELYIQTFDLNPVCALEMGWHLFGENYDRGLLLVKMRQQLRMYGLPETTELPDHLTNGLRLLARMERESGAYFAEAVVLPAVEKMLEAIRGKNNPYEHVLEAARMAVREDFPELPLQPVIPKVETELRVLA